MNSGKVLLGVLAGVAIGAALGILLAPDKGSETRKKILKKGEDLTGDIKSKISDFVDDLMEQKDFARKESHSKV